tara:strand:- start:2 stop:385 length:384 start_codon:yes stop_codon:yes gene_type:complete
VVDIGHQLLHLVAWVIHWHPLEDWVVEDLHVTEPPDDAFVADMYTGVVAALHLAVHDSDIGLANIHCFINVSIHPDEDKMIRHIVDGDSLVMPTLDTKWHVAKRPLLHVEHGRHCYLLGFVYYGSTE